MTAFERTRMPMVMTDPRQPENPIVMANRAFLDLSGYTAEEVIGRNGRFLQGEGTSPAAKAEIRAGLEEEREINVELLNYRKDGSPIWIQLHISPIHDDNGQLTYYFGSHIDVTEYRKVQSLEASEHRLLMEVDHRARNVLAVVDGIVRLSRADDPAQYADSVQRRVHALARAHSLLAQRGWSELPLEELVRQQLAPYGAKRIELSGEAVAISPLAVQPMALVLHELIANAVTHGSLSRPAGQLAVSWSPATDGGFQLRWEETGGEPPPAERRTGFGTTMVGGLIEQQLQGRISRDWREDGLKLTLDVPAMQGAAQAQRP